MIGLHCLPLIRQSFGTSNGRKVDLTNFRTSMVRSNGVRTFRVNTEVFDIVVYWVIRHRYPDQIVQVQGLAQLCAVHITVAILQQNLCLWVHVYASNGLFYHNTLDWSIFNNRVSGVFFITMFIEIPVFNANSVDPDQAPQSAASDLGLHYLQITLWVFPD